MNADIVKVIASAALQYDTSGMCELGKICDLCDCFMTKDNIDDDTSRLMSRATYIYDKLDAQGYLRVS